MNKLLDLAWVLRSKNAGPFHVTFDIIFDNENIYKRVKESGVITKQLISELYKVPENGVSIINYDAANAIKITFLRKHPSGDLDDSDVYGAQQQFPLEGIEIS